MTEQQRHGVYGWLAMAMGIVGYDAWAIMTSHETLSSACRRACQTRTGRSLVTAVWLGLGWHLLSTERQLARALHRAEALARRRPERIFLQNVGSPEIFPLDLAHSK